MITMRLCKSEISLNKEIILIKRIFNIKAKRDIIGNNIKKNIKISNKNGVKANNVQKRTM
ncbi:hypothetical protein RE474_03190 [Methanolobus sediminis]|uniref:Uncharacterized protein n=1 Tax=Methanolobus sediminis TaxID=3072978 RepID=A0AA51YMM0_9EURY|nr:hypothetical protein [Methanolobus sediminis]WMW25738.1 hypothetical protein RE474_03190 [Methanolobus sediminis]